jgi:hypothetical protein
MAAPVSVWVPEQNSGISAALIGPGGDSGPIFIGLRRLFRIWTDNTSGLSINFGLSTHAGGVTSPGTNSYSIGVTPQDFDLGTTMDSIRLVNNSGISSANYFILILSRF